MNNWNGKRLNICPSLTLSIILFPQCPCLDMAYSTSSASTSLVSMCPKDNLDFEIMDWLDGKIY